MSHVKMPAWIESLTHRELPGLAGGVLGLGAGEVGAVGLGVSGDGLAADAFERVANGRATSRRAVAGLVVSNGVASRRATRAALIAGLHLLGHHPPRAHI